ncbi:hypothetical protein CHS0354_033011 [Potamilus streckersoni]|uniref:EGF domain-specific O-linked N-acetylglucosamine transferase n=1 Tax=Potamilus streckersoni TaxID=2493646 RepID=A0AAE0VK59_9BIVA|nr:hypothetical protein CHS0354_033011 [Potamilus streckersoni]
MRKKRSICKIIIAVLLLFFILYLNPFGFVKKSHIEITRVIQDLYRLLKHNEPVSEWFQNSYNSCSGNFVGYNNEFALLKDVIVDPKMPETFYMQCDGEKMPDYRFEEGKEGTHLNKWIDDIHKLETSEFLNVETDNKFTIVVKRYEYANMYHTMTDWYNAFLMITFFNQTGRSTRIILMNEQTRSALDETWEILFDEVLSVRQLSKPVRFSKLVWNILGYESPLNFHGLASLPYIEEFHKFFLGRFDIKNTKPLQCKKLLILFIWRRNYVAHPDNPTGLVKRKIKNEEELVLTLREIYPDHDIQGIQLDAIPMKEQLQWITKTDVLIGMHGAGLSHILFLPPHAAVLELFPLYWTKYTHHHFSAMSSWRGLKYASWQNLNPGNEYPDYSSYMPPSVLATEVKMLVNEMCPS